MAEADLRLTSRARRVTGWSTTAALPGVGMTGIVFADNNHWSGAASAFALLAMGLYFFGTAAYRVKAVGAGRIETHSLLGLRRIDITGSFRVRRAFYGPAVVVVRVGRQRVRLNGGLGRAEDIDAWLNRARETATA